jgi:hypothetical protein
MIARWQLQRMERAAEIEQQVRSSSPFPYYRMHNIAETFVYTMSSSIHQQLEKDEELVRKKFFKAALDLGKDGAGMRTVV